jgi:hypothetical protein
VVDFVVGKIVTEFRDELRKAGLVH